ncbi:MAG TPA: matrixin family metalloprotease [Candidatus Acidoferrum sp.]|nr:matrixin family metalloprotease [Candidatus Acidoferrum sp.]
MKKFLLLILLLSSVFSTSFNFALSQAQGQSQNVDELQIEGLAWHTSTINILLVTPNNVSWWNPMYINSTLRAIGQWNEAIQEFASNNTQYSFLTSLKLESTVSNVSEPGFNIYLNWTQSPLAGSVDAIGLTTLSSDDNLITNCSINLATHTSHGDALADGDEQNIALHELGHSLGLGHTNETNDVMFPDLSLLGPAKLLSNLDLIGISTTFAWLTYTFNFYPVTDWLTSNPVYLPTSQYQALPVSAQNARPQTLENNSIIQTIVLAAEIAVHPEFLPFVILFVVILVITALFPRRKKKQVDTTVSETTVSENK